MTDIVRHVVADGAGLVAGALMGLLVGNVAVDFDGRRPTDPLPMSLHSTICVATGRSVGRSSCMNLDDAPSALNVVPISASPDDRWRLTDPYVEDVWSEFLGPTATAGIGTVYAPHVAPEAGATMQGSAHADQFSMAMTLGHLLTGGDFCSGAVPHPSDTKAWKHRPNLGALGLHVPERLRRVIARATSFDPDDRFESVEEFKRQVDRATPAMSFMPDADGSLVSTDGTTVIVRSTKRTGCTVEVLVNGRRRTADCRKGLTDAEADKHTRSLVGRFGYPK